MNEFEGYVKNKELRKYFNVSARTVARWLRENCPCIRIGAGGEGDPRFRISEVEAWLNVRTEVAKR